MAEAFADGFIPNFSKKDTTFPHHNLFQKSTYFPSKYHWMFSTPPDENLISRSAPLLTFPTVFHAFIHLSCKITHSIIQFILFLPSPLSLSVLFFLCMHLSFLISDSLPLPNSHSCPCLPAFPPITLSLPLFSLSPFILSLQEMVSFPVQGVAGYTHCPKQRGHCVNPPKIQRRKGRQIIIRNLLSSASPIQTSTHAHFTSASHALSFARIFNRENFILFYFFTL